MMVIMRPGHTGQQFEDVMKRIEEAGMTGHPIVGVERTVIGVVGTERMHPELADDIETMEGVEATVRISSPYKLSSRELHPVDTIVDVRGVKIGEGTVTVMAGPCAIESEEQVMATARAVKAAGASVLRGGAFKPRTSPYGFRGLEEQGLKFLRQASDETGLPVVTEVMSESTVEVVAKYADILQIGTRNAQNFFLLEEAALTGKPVLLKRGMSSSVQDWLLAAEYILNKGNKDLILCERGIRTFETATRNTMDINAIPLVKEMSHLPIIADPSHGTGKAKLVLPVGLGMVAAGADGLILEVHPSPEHALCDGAQSLTFEQ
ncbi:MAG: 3-deoxy-7-phosphoheptulonate synthase, partial [Dehalococcoidia bacterium]